VSRRPRNRAKPYRSRLLEEGIIRSNRHLPLVALGLLPLIWGYSWVPLKIGLDYSPPFTLAALRCLPGAFLILGFAAVLRHPIKLKAARYTIPLGLLQTGGFIGLVTAGLVTGGAGRTAILANTWQFWILVLAWPILGERLRSTQWASVFLALVGLVLIIEPWKLEGVTSALLVLAGAFCWAVGSIVVRLMRRKHEVDPLVLNGWQVLFGSIPLVVVAVFLEGESPQWTTELIWTLLFSIIMTTCVAAFLWLYVLREMPASLAGLGTMATPVVGLLASWAWLGEQPTVLVVVGMVLILVASAILFARGLRGPALATGSSVQTPPTSGEKGADG
jgi:drug/metabolite transporter (DMT)-like permease